MRTLGRPLPEQCYTTPMKVGFFGVLFVLLLLVASGPVTAQTNTASIFTQNLSLGSSGAQVVLLQKLLNTDPDTRIATTGIGSPGNETEYFGSLTRAAVIRFQEKYADDILTPSGLSQGNGRVGAYTRAKLNSLSAHSITPTSPTTTSPIAPTALSTPVDYHVKASEKTDIYAGDTKIALVQERLRSAMNSFVSSGGTGTMPAIAVTDVPSVLVQSITPQSGIPGTPLSIATRGLTGESMVYFGTDYIVRAVSKDSSGTVTLTIPSIPPGLYDVAITSAGTVSNTTPFVVIDPRNPIVHIQSISPTTIGYNGTITITGSGFSSTRNTVMTNYQKFVGLPSPDGKTLTIVLTPENLREAARLGKGTRAIQMFLYVINEYGFSDSKKYFTMTI
jgi:hypothetical protein